MSVRSTLVGPGATVLLLSWIITLYTLWQMVEMHEMVPGKRFDRYHELGRHAFGDKLGLWIVIPQQIIVEVGTCIVYTITGAKSLKKVHDTICPDCRDIRTSYWIVIFASVNFVLAQLMPQLQLHLCYFFRYSTISWCASIAKGVEPDVNYGLRATNSTDAVFNFLSALGDVAFAYAGHNVVLEIQATMPSTPETPSKKPMWRGVILAYIGVAFCYLPVAFIGYYVFGNSVDDNILITLERPSWLIATANLFVFAHVFAMPVFDMIETYMVTKLNFPPSAVLRVTTRSVYVALTTLVAICIPFFGSLLGFLGGFASAPTSFFLPCIIWLKLIKPKRYGLSWTINWICIVLGVLLMILSPIAAMRNIIMSAKDYKFFS
ncbi:hypothetical protein VIGAN_04426100 [Vigna angularis var. angularis]|uniref:Amino acid transporter transmembrane domain-containing protein n=1 Tax=Vigna angularis var. angularis TaxID=157739 RepID=A0A0S3S167_PHAAN|nr:hypothetical protein VIGAN_04426100 [Vigna angularis var. angularis]